MLCESVCLSACLSLCLDPLSLSRAHARTHAGRGPAAAEPTNDDMHGEGEQHDESHLQLPECGELPRVRGGGGMRVTRRVEKGMAVKRVGERTKERVPREEVVNEGALGESQG